MTPGPERANVYLHARYYDPALGLFISPDPLHPARPGVGTHRYGYGFGNPVNLADGSGLDLCEPYGDNNTSGGVWCHDPAGGGGGGDGNSGWGGGGHGEEEIECSRGGCDTGDPGQNPTSPTPTPTPSPTPTPAPTPTPTPSPAGTCDAACWRERNARKIDAAAVAGLKKVLPESLKQDLEKCFGVCQKGQSISTTRVTTGQTDACVPFHKSPSGSLIVAEAHTHGRTGGTFSSNDIGRADFLGLPSYVADQFGQILKYDPSLPRNVTQKQEWLCWLTPSGMVCK